MIVSVLLKFYPVSCVAYSILGQLLINFVWNVITKKSPDRVALQGATAKGNYFHQHVLSEDHHRLLEDWKITLIDWLIDCLIDW